MLFNTICLFALQYIKTYMFCFQFSDESCPSFLWQFSFGENYLSLLLVLLSYRPQLKFLLSINRYYTQQCGLTTTTTTSSAAAAAITIQTGDADVGDSSWVDVMRMTERSASNEYHRLMTDRVVTSDGQCVTRHVVNKHLRTHTDRHTRRETQTERQKYRQRDGQTERQTYRQTD